MKKPSRTTLRNKLDKICGEITRSKGRCERCNTLTTLQTAHIFSRTNLVLRWNIDNLLCLCYRCHFHFAHSNPVEFTEWLKTYLGEVKYNNLRMMANSTKKWDNYELQELYMTLKKYKENMWADLDK